MQNIDINQAKHRLPELVEQTITGKEIILTKGGRPIAKIVGIHKQKKQRHFGIDILPIELNHLAGLINLPFHHRDPFDRLIITQSITEEVPVITSDDAFRSYPVSIIR